MSKQIIQQTNGTPVAADWLPFDRNSDSATFACQVSDVLNVGLGQANTWTKGPQQITTDSKANSCLKLKAAASQSANVLDLLDSSGASQFAVRGNEMQVDFNQGSGSDSVGIRGSFANVTFLSGAGTIATFDMTATRIGSGVVESQADGGALVIRPRVANASDGGILTIHGGDGNGTDKNGGVLRLYGGAKTGAGVVGDTLLNHDGTNPVGHLRLGSDTATATVAVGSLAFKFQVFDAAGNSLGFIPIYSSIT